MRGRSDLLDRTFRIAVLLKGLDGLAEIVGGTILLFVSPVAINRFVEAVTRNELSQDPHDFVATHLLHTAHGLHGTSLVFGAIYLLSHGVVKIVLVAAVLANRLWAYPWLIAFLVAFVFYQLYRIAVRVTFGMVGLTVFDAIVVWLTVREYQRVRARSRPA
jgi:uncharacterized membrane protein